MEIFERRILVDSENSFPTDGNRRYEAAVVRVLRNVFDRTATGRALFPSLSPGRNIVVPEPRRRTSQCSNAQDAHLGAQAAPRIVAGSRVLTAVARFTPKYYCRGGVWDIRAVLFHELFHLRDQRRPLTPPNAYYRSGEEFITVVATNVLRSELRVELRKGYGDFTDPLYERLCAIAAPTSTHSGTLQMRSGSNQTLRSPSASCPHAPTPDHLRAFSTEFAQAYQSTLEAFRGQEGEIFGRLRSTPAPFNPFRDL